jgi:transcriptional regulator of arginine metabolism
VKEKEARLAAVRRIIREQPISSQETLLDKLKQEGFAVTQATLSRDLKALKVSKAAGGEEGYTYRLPGRGKESSGAERDYLADVRLGFLSYEFSRNLCVIKTPPGHAAPVALALDNLGRPEFAGSVAGDDTIFLVLKEGVKREKIDQFFRSLL